MDNIELKEVNEELPDKKSARGQPSFWIKWRQHLVALAVLTGIVSGGITLAWPFAAAFYLLKGKGRVSMFEEENMLTWLLMLGAVLGAVICGVLAHTLGRKVSIASQAFPFALSWILLLTLNEDGWMLTARFFSGMGLGGVFVGVPIYLVEIAEDHIRGSMGGLLQVMFVAGMLLPYLFAAAGIYWLLNTMCLLMSVVFFFSAICVPETPHYLLSKGRTAQALSSLHWLRGDHDKALHELQALEAARLEDKHQNVPWQEAVCSRGYIKALIISLGLVGCQQMTGFLYVAFTMESIFEQSRAPLSSSASAVVVGVLALLLSCGVLVFIDRIKRKTLLLGSVFLMTIALLFLGFFCWLQRTTSNTRGIWWLPISSILVYMASYSMGLGPLTWLVAVEVLPFKIRCIVGLLMSSLCWVMLYLINIIAVSMETTLGAHYAFWYMAFTCGSTGLFVAHFVIETGGKSLQQVEKDLFHTK